MKTCSTCKQVKELICFSKNKYSKNGLHSPCKDCQKKYREEIKAKNLEKNIDIQKSQCTKCLQFLDVSFFHKKKNSLKGIDYWCFHCRKKYIKENRLKNLQKARQKNNERRKERIEWFQKLKINKPCKDCGLIYEPYCMDYDHLNNKLKNVSRMVLQNTPKNIILQEIEKCDLVCCLCHNIRTKNRLDEKFKNKKYKKNILRNIEIINKLKSVPCAFCHVQRDLCNMQFDHIDQNNKYKNICQLKSFKVDILKNEIKKCRVICALCHRKKSIAEQKENIINNNKIKKIKLVIRKRKKETSAGKLWCNKCSMEKDTYSFSKRKNSKTGYDHYCKQCLSEYKKKYREKLKMLKS